MASAVIVALRLAARRPHDRWNSVLLVAHWAWSALAYHVAFFMVIVSPNLFAFLCLVPDLSLAAYLAGRVAYGTALASVLTSRRRAFASRVSQRRLRFADVVWVSVSRR
jgi:hypothetical protein